MDELKSAYIQGLSARVEALEASLNELHLNSKESMETIVRIAHSLKGSGGTYGFPEISEAAGKFDEYENQSDLNSLVEFMDFNQLLDEFLDLLYTTISSNKTDQPLILIVEDDPDISNLLNVKLSDTTRKVMVAGDYKTADEILKVEDVSLIILDLVLPDIDGRNLLLELRQRSKTLRIPIIILSSKTSYEVKTECFALGADAFIEKPFDPEMVSAAVSSHLQRSGQLKQEVLSDSLTSLPNRAGILESFKKIYSLSERSGEELSLSIIDLDKFKSINDTHGHNAGDETLRRFAKVVQTSLRESDILGRWGGEEFIALFPNTDLNGAHKALEKALETFKNEKIEGKQEDEFSVSFSAGLVAVERKEEVEETIARADKLLYQAKSQGRSRIISGEAKLEGQAKMVLMAEDDDLTASVVIHRLEREGFKVIHFEDGQKAYDWANENVSDIVILDVKMPGMDGFELLGKLRKLNEYKKIPIMMLTSMGKESDVVRGLESGASDYLLKPFSPIEIVARVNRLLS